MASYLFFFMFSRFLLIYNIITVIITYYVVKFIEQIANKSVTTSKEKALVKKRKKQILALGIVSNLLILLILKYTNFFGGFFTQLINDVNSLFKEASDMQALEYQPIRFLIPIGISYYTLQAISYIVDVYRGTTKAEPNIMKVALYMSFFPTIVEGPITRFNQVSQKLFSGENIDYYNLTKGYQRILWGLFKKVVLADHMVVGVNKIFDNGVNYDGSVYLYGAILCTLQLYMDFAGTIDIVIGTGRIFGIELPENFRQPFFAKNAGDFWRRWHITLGTFFKDYIFYPISFAKPLRKLTKRTKKLFGNMVSKRVVPTLALFCVWCANGLWHGPKGAYLFYGMYYFVLIFIENCLENPINTLFEKLKIKETSIGIRVFRFIKLFIIVIIGEMFFRADTLSLGFHMFKEIFTNFHPGEIVPLLSSFVLEPYDYLIMFIGVIIVFIVDVLKEKSISISLQLLKLPKAVRWTIWYAAIFVVIIFGAYGPGFNEVAMMYAGF
jgi:D-alanyl-lipoteichoic acid acyltransferase DltB (MBOAT superfamily)